MAKENSKFIKLIGITIVLLLIVIIALLAMPRMNEAREKAFRVEATRVVDAAKVAIKQYDNGKFKLSDNSLSCRKGTNYCFTISELEKLGFYKSSNDDYVGKVVIDVANTTPQYYLYLKRSTDLKIIGGFREDYINMGTISIEMWEDSYETCNCE